MEKRPESLETINRKIVPMNYARNNYNKKEIRYPRLVLSVIGDSRTFVPKPWLTSVFKLGLIETVKGAKDCLILYEGSEEKISSLVREAVHDFQVVNKDDDTIFISLVGISHPVVDDNSHAKKEEEDRFALKGGEYVELLSKLSMNYVPFMELGRDNKLKTPVLVIVAEGDGTTIELVVNLLECCIPVLVLKGSGKAADLIADCLNDKNAINVKAPLLLGTFFHTEEMKLLKNLMKKIRKREQFVNILDISTQDEVRFPEAVSNAIIRAWAQGGTDKPVKYDIPSPEKENSTELDKERLYDNSEKSEKESKFPDRIIPQNRESGIEVTSETLPGSSFVSKSKSTFGINSVHPKSVTMHNAKMGGEVEVHQESLTPASLPLYFYIAYQSIQEMSNENDKRKNFQILLKQALVANRVDYVIVLLQEEKVEFDIQHFPYIYNKVASPDSSEKLLENLTENELPQNRIYAGRQLCQKFLHYPRKAYKSDELKMEKDMYHDLLIWAIFCNRIELATLFWSKCSNQLQTAFLASCVLKRMAAISRNVKDQILYNSIKEHLTLFEQRSIDLQTLIYEEDAVIAMELIMADCTVWDIKVNPLECAHDNTMYDFIAHSCAQRRLNTIWYQKIGATLGEFLWNGFLCGCNTMGKKKDLALTNFFFAPLTRFTVHYLTFIGALVCFSAFLLTELSEFEGFQSIKIYDWAIYIWFFGDIIEEYREVFFWNEGQIESLFNDGKQQKPTQKNSNGQMACSGSKQSKPLQQTISYKLKKYLFDFWNALDVFSYIITTVAIGIRFLVNDSYDDIGTNNYTIGAKFARRAYSLSLFTMYMRFLHAILMSRKLGPKIIMIKEMLKDLFRFIGILFVFMVGVGVLYHANMYPAHYDMWNGKDWTYWRIWKIIYIPYWQIYGELFLEEFQANSTTPCTTIQSEWENNPEVERCNEYDWVLIVIAALYLLLSNLLLVNLVIALFSYRFEMVQANSERLWRYWRYTVIMDYRTRIPSPLNLFIRPFMLFGICMKKCSKICLGQDYDIDQNVLERMKVIQDICANKCIRSATKNKQSNSPAFY